MFSNPITIKQPYENTASRHYEDLIEGPPETLLPKGINFKMTNEKINLQKKVQEKRRYSPCGGDTGLGGGSFLAGGDTERPGRGSRPAPPSQGAAGGHTSWGRK